MNCATCNTRNNYFHNYCHHCGAKLNPEELQLPAGRQAGPMDGVLLNKHRETFNPYRDKKRSRKRLLYTLTIALIGLAGIALWAVLR